MKILRKICSRAGLEIVGEEKTAVAKSAALTGL
jgi:hypothetical protein